LSQRWGSKELVHARKTVSRWGEPLHVCEEMTALRDAKASDYWRLLREPDFFEDLAVSARLGYIEAQFITSALGAVVPDRWDRWAVFVASIDDGTGSVYANFRALAAAMRDDQPARGLRRRINRLLSHH